MDHQLTDTILLLVKTCAGLFLVGVVVYHSFLWIKNCTWERLIVIIRKGLRILPIFGKVFIFQSAFLFMIALAVQVWDDKLQVKVKDLDNFFQAGWTSLWFGLAFAIAGALARRYTLPTAGPQQDKTHKVF